MKLVCNLARYKGEMPALLELVLLENGHGGLTLLYLKIERVCLYIALEGI